MDFSKGSELRCSLPTLDKLIQHCHKEKKRKKKRQRKGVKDFTAFSGILDAFLFFTGKGERDYWAPGWQVGVSVPGTLRATKGECC